MDDVLRTMWPIIQELTDDSDKNPASIYASLQALNLWQDTHDSGRALPGSEVTMARGREEALALANYACRFSFAVYGLGGGFFVNVLTAGGAKLSTMLDRLADDDIASFCRDSGLPRGAVLYVSDDAEIGVPRHFVALDHENKTVVLAIRGSMSLADAFTDLLALNVPFCGGEAHKGIADSARAVYASTIGVITAALFERRNIAGETWRLLVTGHSLGAGTSILFTILLNYNIAKGLQMFPPGIPIQCVAFAPPPVFTAPLSPLAKEAFAAFDANAAAADASGLPAVPLPSTPLPTHEDLAAVLPVAVQNQIISWVHHDDLVSRLSLTTIRDTVRILTRIGTTTEGDIGLLKRLYATHLPGSLSGDAAAEVTQQVDGILRTYEGEWLHKWYGIRGSAALPDSGADGAALAGADGSADGLSKFSTSGLSGLYATGPVTASPDADGGSVGGAGSLPASSSSTSASLPVPARMGMAPLPSAPIAGGEFLGNGDAPAEGEEDYGKVLDSWDPFAPTKPVATGAGTGTAAKPGSTPATTTAAGAKAAGSAVKSALRQPPLVIPGSIYCFRSPEEWKDLVPYKPSSSLGHDDPSCLVGTASDAPIHSVGKAAASVENALYTGAKTVSEYMSPVATSVSSNVKSGVMSAFGALASFAKTPAASAPQAGGVTAIGKASVGGVSATATTSVTVSASNSSGTATSASATSSLRSFGSSLLSQAAAVARPPAGASTGTGSAGAKAASGSSGPAPVVAQAAVTTTGTAPAGSARALHISVPPGGAVSASASGGYSVVTKIVEEGPLITRAHCEQLSILPTTSRAWRDHLPDVYVHTLRHLRDVCRYQRTHGVDQVMTTATGGTVAVASPALVGVAQAGVPTASAVATGGAMGAVPVATVVGTPSSAGGIPMAMPVPTSPAFAAASGFHDVMGSGHPSTTGASGVLSPGSTVSTGSGASGTGTGMKWMPL